MTRYYRKPALLTKLPPDRPAVIEASAGTGKTYTLEHLVIELVLRGTPLESILVVTFTEKATAELVTRVRAKIQELLGPFPDAEPGPDCWAIDEAARARLEAALFAFDRAQISTIHAFCQRVLTEHAFAHRRLFVEEQVDERAAFAAAFKDTLRHELALDPALVPYLRAWLEHEGDVEKLHEVLLKCHQVQAPIEPDWDEAALVAELDRLLASPPPGPAPRLARLLELMRAWQAERDTPALLAALFAEDANRKAWRGGILSALPESLRRRLVRLEVAVAQTFLVRVRARLAAQKREAGRFDFQDMLQLVARSLDGPEAGALLSTLRERYRCALIDEFQDTDEVQWRIFERIFFEGGLPLYVIGDPKQAIYGFRGADVQTYLRVRRQLEEAGGAVLPLDENFRSTADVIDAYNLILKQDVDEPFFDGDIQYDRPVRCGLPARALLGSDGRPARPVVLFEVEPSRELDKTGKPKAHPAPVVRAALAARIAAEIRAILGPGERALLVDRGDGHGPRKLLQSEIFVLTYSKNEGYEVGEALRALGVDYAYYKQDGLFQTDEARHVLDLLRAICDPHRRSRRLRAWLTPFFGLTLEELGQASEAPGTHPLLARLLDWKALADAQDYERLFTRVLEESGLPERALFTEESERALTNYQHLFEVLLEQAQRSGVPLDELCRTLAGFIAQRAAPEGIDGNVQRLESERAAVQILTMHKSKGLEAEVVFLYGGMWRDQSDPAAVYHDPDGRRRAWLGEREESIDELVKREVKGEEQRLMYVALTRARSRLYLPWLPNKLSIGCYRHLNKQLGRVQGDPRFAVEPLAVRATAALYDVSQRARALADFRPPPETLAPVAHAGDFAQLRREHEGFFVTSYTRMKQAQARSPGRAGDRAGERAGSGELSAEDFTGERAPAQRPELPDDELPGGAATGIFLHELIEQLELAFCLDPLPVFSTRPEVRGLAERLLRRHGHDPRHLAHALRLVHTALSAPVELGGARLARGFAAADRVLREIEFLYPWPEDSHPRLDEARGRGTRFTVERGFVKGFVDLVVEDAGRVYFADWKSDLLPSWEPEALLAHAVEHYQLQARLYALALVRWLGLTDRATYDARFGGLAFCFLRGMRPGDGRAGVCFQRPGWDEVLDWEARLRRGERLTDESAGARP